MLLFFGIKFIAELIISILHLLILIIPLLVVACLCVFLLFLPLLFTLIHGIFQIGNDLILFKNVIVMSLILLVDQLQMFLLLFGKLAMQFLDVLLEFIDVKR